MTGFYFLHLLNTYTKKGLINMRNSNGYGGLIKLGGKRRKPYAIRVTVGWTDEGKQIYKYISYHTTKREAMIALAEYNKNPYDIDATFL